MNCPRCAPSGGAAANPYRGDLRHGAVVALATERHAYGVDIARCRSCRGVFAEHENLVAIENGARREKRGVSRAEAGRRTWDPPTAPIGCPSCNSETTRREWSIGTLIFVDVCVECRGVWLDGGELEALGG